MRLRKKPRLAERSGWLMLELVVAAAIVAAGGFTAVQLLRVERLAVRSLQHRQRATDEVRNALESLQGRKTSELTTAKLEGIAITPQAAHVLTEAKLHLDVAPELDGELLRITAEVTWQERRAAPAVSVKLTRWIAPPTEVSP